MTINSNGFVVGITAAKEKVTNKQIYALCGDIYFQITQKSFIRSLKARSGKPSVYFKQSSENPKYIWIERIEFNAPSL